MTLLIRLTVTGILLAAMLIGGSLLPPFPPEFGAALQTFFSTVLVFDHWFPVRLACELFVWVVLVDSVVYGFRVARWVKSFLLGEAKA